jgi:SAM-dependent MidA family methyltransferase
MKEFRLYDDGMESSTTIQLPEPAADALAHSQRLVQHIRDEIGFADGWIPFSRYMELALYAPGLGYYAAGARKFGTAGDFVTAPELTPLFSRALAHQVVEVLEACPGDILELGAGSGRLALDLLLELERLGHLPERYAILEVSPDLQARQRQLFGEMAPHLLQRVAWLEGLPTSFSGVVLGNEVLDALPVHMLHRAGGVLHERGVGVSEAGRFVWQDRPLENAELIAAAGFLPGDGDYQTEVCPAASGLLRSLGSMLDCGGLLFLDYGFPRAEFYHPQRSMGTLMCHYRHHAFDDPFYLPGLTDITAHVEFTAVADAGLEAGLAVMGYATQAHFLVNCGILDRLAELEPGSRDYLRQAAAVQKLLSPSEMGELFKVMALGKGLDIPLRGFARGDRRHTL